MALPGQLLLAEGRGGHTYTRLQSHIHKYMYDIAYMLCTPLAKLEHCINCISPSIWIYAFRQHFSEHPCDYSHASIIAKFYAMYVCDFVIKLEQLLNLVIDTLCSGQECWDPVRGEGGEVV